MSTLATPTPLLRRLLLAGASSLILVAAGCGSGSNAGEPASSSSLPEITVSDADLVGNPFLDEWGTPYGVPPFSDIEASDYLPAFKKGILEKREEIAAIRDNPDAPTFENTIVALERSGALLTKVNDTFSNILGTESTEDLQAINAEISPLLARERDAMLLDPGLFARIEAVYDARDSLDLGIEDARLLELTYKNFVRAGAKLTPDQKAELAKINSELAELDTKFDENLLKATAAFKLELTTPEDLAGLSEDFKTAIKVEGEDKWVVGLSRSQFEGFMTQSDNRELRRKVFDGYRLRASGGEFDNNPVILKMVQLRAKKAELLGYKNFAELALEDTLIKTPENAEALLLRVWEPGLARAKEELADIQSLIDAEGGDFTAAGEDWWHYAEKVRAEKYAFDSSQLRPYFELEATREGLFDVVNKLFGVTMTPVDIPVWNPVVVSWEVRGPDDEYLGVFMSDMFSRDSKRGGAWMNTYRDAYKVDGTWTRPIVTNNLNVTKPPPGEPVLLTFDEAETLYHEFGHAMHGLLTTVGYASFSGTATPRDYVEFPSQLLENWVPQPEVLLAHARHYQTGEPIPLELVEKVKKAATFNQGFMTTEYVAASLLDLAWHRLTYEEAMQITDVRAFEKEVLEGYGLIPEIEPRYRSPYFAHIFAGGYSSRYYAYLESEVLAADAFQAFVETGDIFNPEVAARLKTYIYEAGGRKPADELYREFRGKDPGIEPLLISRGFDPNAE